MRRSAKAALCIVGLTLCPIGQPSNPTSVVVAAHRMADESVRRELSDLMVADELDESAIAHWRALIVATGAPDWIEELITERVAAALNHIDDHRIDDAMRSALATMAALCTSRMT